MSRIEDLRARVNGAPTSPKAIQPKRFSTLGTSRHLPPTYPLPKAAQPGPNPRGAKDIHRNIKQAVDPDGLRRGRSPGFVPKFQGDRVDVVLDALRRGNYRTVASALAGIHVETFRRWMRVGEEDPTSKYHKFYLDVLEAEAEAEDDILTHVRHAVPDDWRAGIEILRRRHPERWNREKVEVSGPHGGPVTIKVVYESSTVVADPNE